MKRVKLTSALVLLTVIPAPAFAAEFQGYGTSIFRFEQRATPGFEKKNVIPFTQFAGADVEKVAGGNLSLHLYGWERVDLADRSTNEKNSDGDLTYGYLDYRFPKANAHLKGGRFFISEGVAFEQVDGVSAGTDLPMGFAVAVFTGAPVKLDRGSNTKGDFIAGGRGSYRYAQMLEIGLSGLHESGGIYDPASGVKADRQLVGADLYLSPTRRYELSGHTFYNTATEGLSENSYQFLVRPVKNVTLSLLYNQADLMHYYAASNLRSLFNPDIGGKVRSYGGMVTWQIAAPVEVSVDYRRIARSSSLDPDLNGDSDRVGADARFVLLEKKARSGLSYHRVAGAAGFNSYDELRGYFLYDNGRYIASFDGIGQRYQSRIFNSKDAFELIASGGTRIIPQLALSADLSYAQNPRLEDDLRGLVRLTFNFVKESKGANK